MINQEDKVWMAMAQMGVLHLLCCGPSSDDKHKR